MLLPGSFEPSERLVFFSQCRLNHSNRVRGNIRALRLVAQHCKQFFRARLVSIRCAGPCEVAQDQGRASQGMGLLQFVNGLSITVFCYIDLTQTPMRVGKVRIQLESFSALLDGLIVLMRISVDSPQRPICLNGEWIQLLSPLRFHHGTLRFSDTNQVLGIPLMGESKARTEGNSPLK